MGSGPAGLAAAQQLNWAGHTAVVFEKDDRIGGLLRYGIPDYKIEKWVVDRRIAMMEEEGVEFRTNAHVGENPTTEELKSEFDAVVLAVGALQGRDLDVPGRDLDGIHLAMDYLVQQNRRVAGLPVEAEVEIRAAGKNVDHPWRRRHERRLPRQRPPRGLRLGQGPHPRPEAARHTPTT